MCLLMFFTLFYFLLTNHSNAGSAKDKKKAGSKAGDLLGGITVSKDELRDIRKKTETGQKSDAIVITNDELFRMKDSTKIQTKEQASQ